MLTVMAMVVVVAAAAAAAMTLSAARQVHPALQVRCIWELVECGEARDAVRTGDGL